MDSKNIIQTLLADLKSYIDDKTVIFETYMERATDLEPRQDIPRARIALYHGVENVTVKVGAEKPADSRQAYHVQISVLKAYRGDDGSKGELPCLELRDKVVGWSIGLEPRSVTGEIFTLSYDSSSAFFRDKRYVTLTLNFTAFRKLIT